MQRPAADREIGIVSNGIRYPAPLICFSLGIVFPSCGSIGMPCSTGPCIVALPRTVAMARPLAAKSLKNLLPPGPFSGLLRPATSPSRRKRSPVAVTLTSIANDIDIYGCAHRASGSSAPGNDVQFCRPCQPCAESHRVQHRAAGCVFICCRSPDPLANSVDGLEIGMG